MSDAGPPHSHDRGATGPARDRKAEHLDLALRPDVQLKHSAFDDYTFEHVALPEIDLAAVDTRTTFLGKPLQAPLLISCMTGGTEAAGRINRNLAAAAEAAGIALGVGSQRKAMEDPAQVASFAVRDVAPTVPLLANLGAVQLNYGFGIEACEAAVAMIGADALAFHLNPLQEAIQPEGQCNFTDLLPKLEAVAEVLSVPVVVKEIGCGLSERVVRALAGAGIHIVDTAGLGGTSWARIEALRAGDEALGEVFAAWGIPTPVSIVQAARVPGVTVVGSGGIRNGLDAAKAIALGAGMVGMAAPFLRAAVESTQAVRDRIDLVLRELRITMFCLGVRTIEELQQVEIFRRDPR